jgi:cystathionine beta-lyase
VRYDFDQVIDRQGTASLMCDGHAARGKEPGTLPLWVADMGFKAPPPVLDALSARVEHGVFGYSEPDSAYYDALRGWLARRHGWDVDRRWVMLSPGVVFALYTAVRALTRPGDGVLIQPPVYYPFAAAVRDTGRRLVTNPLTFDGERYSIDFADFEAKLADAKVFILCSPHNPVGCVWTEAELRRVGELCVRHGVTVIADEIHADFVYPGARHHVFAALDDSFADITLTCTAPSKTFNLAGLQLANVVAASPELRRAYLRAYRNSGFSQLGALGIVAARAAYAHGDDWVDQLVDYLAGTRDAIRDALTTRASAVKLVHPEGTYLAWLDCRALGLDDDALDRLVEEKARLWLDPGTIFGPEGSGFQRLNFAYPRSVVSEAINRLGDAAATVG